MAEEDASILGVGGLRVSGQARAQGEQAAIRSEERLAPEVSGAEKEAERLFVLHSKLELDGVDRKAIQGSEGPL